MTPVILTGGHGHGIKPLVLQFCSSVDPIGGIYTYVNILIKSRLSERYRFDICFYPRPTRGISPRIILELVRRFRAQRPALLHVHGHQTAGFHAAVAARLVGLRPVLLTIHGFIEDLRFRQPWRQRVIRDVIEASTLWQADAVYCVSAYGAAKPALARLGCRSLGSISNALPIRPPDPPNPELRASFGFGPQDIVALCISRLSKEKGILDLARAFSLLRSPSGVAQPKLLLVGDGPHAETIAAEFDSLRREGRVALAGRRDDVYALQAIADLFVLPTLHENQSYAILEAMMAGRAVVTTRVGGNPELVVDGETGVLVPPADPAAMGMALARLASDPGLRARMGRAGRERVERHFALPRLVDRIDAIYQSLL